MAERTRKWRYWFRVIHRDVGYFLFGMTIIYGISGIALNHIRDFDPSYEKINKNIMIDTSKYKLDNDEDIMKIVDVFNEAENYKKHKIKGNGSVKVYLDKGSIIVNPDGEVKYEKFKRRPVLHAVNFLHYNPGHIWKWFSDAFAFGMILLAVTGIFLVKGRHSISKIGLIYTVLGIIIPLILLYIYYK